MKKKSILLITSIALNCLLIVFGSYKMLKTYQQHLTEVQLSFQPEKVPYFVGRNEILEKLPIQTNGIIMLGDSHIQNFEWREMFKDLPIINRGINGDITKGVLHRMNEVVERQPKKVFLEIGINDLLFGYAIDSIFNNYKTIIQIIKAKSPTTEIYVQSLFPTSRNINYTDKPVFHNVLALNRRLKEYCDTQQMPYIDLLPNFVSDQKLNPLYDCGDSLHLNSEGYKLWCQIIKNYIVTTKAFASCQMIK